MAAASHAYEYEIAAQRRNQIKALTNFKQSLVFKSLNSLDDRQDQALVELSQLFGLKEPLKRIEAYDISHISGRYTTASMVVAQNGVLNATLSRRFKSSIIGNNDFAQILDILKRRFKMSHLKM